MSIYSMSYYNDLLSLRIWIINNHSLRLMKPIIVISILSKLTSGGFDRTTDSLEALSDKISAIETKVDTIDTVVDNLPTSSWVSWAGYTSNYNWDMDWSYWMNEKCNTAYPWSKAMTYQDWIDLWTDYPNTKNAWIIDGMDTIGELDDLTTNNYAITKDWNDYELFSGRDCMSINCNWWNSYSSTFKWAYVSYNNKSLYITGCNITNVPIPCVYK